MPGVVLELVLVLAMVAAVIALIRWMRRPELVVRLGDGTARLERGDPPAGLLSDLREIGRLDREAHGRVLVRGSGARLDVRTPGLDDATRQRVRNVLMLYRDRL